MISHTWSRCGGIHKPGEKCRAVRDYKQTDERKLRNKYSWASKSKEIRHKAMNLCELCKLEDVYTYDNLEVHHIYPLKTHPKLLLDNNNLICLCKDHHRMVERGAISPEELMQIARKREENY